MALEILEAIELSEGGRELGPVRSRIAARRLASGVGWVDVVDHERLGDRLDPVDDVVQSRRELVDVLAIERRDERVLEPSRDLLVDLVTALLECLDVGDPGLQAVVLVDHRVEPVGGLRRGSRRRR